MNELPTIRQIHGSCHCGNITTRFDWPEAGPTIPVRACGCSFCTKHGAAWTSHPDGAFELEIGDEAQVSRFQFGTGTADFYVCLTCGVAPIVVCEMEGREFAVLNVNTFDDVDRSELVSAPVDFEGEDTENRLARRRRNWTPRAA